jgi:predicted nucleic acid-binding protein|tara:strand:- start:59 stop:202 length:144 start_codon:yes stop_codon:yes gene_type:complete
MKCEVKLFKAGTIFTEEVIAKDYQDARQVALARNPNATVVSVNASFK